MLREDERKRLVRAVQQAKHEQSLKKQQEAGAKNHAKAKAKQAAKQARGQAVSAEAQPVPTDTSACNGEYYELVQRLGCD